MNDVLHKQPQAVALVGLVLVIIGTLGSNSESLNGNPVKLIFDIGAVAGWVLLISGIVIFVKSRKAK